MPKLLMYAVLVVVLLIFTTTGGVKLAPTEKPDDTSECASNPCQNEGTCLEGINGYTCNCQSGWEGSQCNMVMLACPNSPCKNDATCYESYLEPGTYLCVCPTGYEGDMCDKYIGPCASEPCLNGATCVDLVEELDDGYTCHCVEGYRGIDCWTAFGSTRDIDFPLCMNEHVCASHGSECQTSTTTACQCDDICNFFNDCCKDLSCDIQDNSPSGYDQLDIDHARIDCVRPVYGDNVVFDVLDNLSSGVFMIDKCPDTDSDLAKKCQEVTSTDIKYSIPVSESVNGITFKNVYCALCNNIVPENIIWWRILARCDTDSLPELQNLTGEETLADTLAAISDKCPISFGFPDGAPTSSIGNRRCYVDVVDGRGCNPDTPGKVLDQCNEYTAYVTDRTGTIYRNMHCYICSNYVATNNDIYDDTEIKLECNGNIPLIPIRGIGGGMGGVQGGGGPGGGPGGMVLPPPISVIVDFSSNSGVTVEIADTIITLQTVTCNEGQVYDPFADECTNVTCPKGYTLIDDRCEIIPQHQCGDNFEVTIQAAATMKNISNCLKNAYFQSRFVIQKESHLCSEDTCQYTFNVESSDTLVDLETYYDAIFLPEGSEELLRTCNITAFTLSQHCESEFSDCDDQVTLTNVSIKSHTNISTVVVSQDTEYLFSRGILALQYTLLEKENKLEKLITADVCEGDRLSSCVLITLNASLFTNLSGAQQLVFLPTGELYTENEYTYTPDGRIQVCSFLEMNGTRNETHTITFLAYDTIQIVLSLVGCVISMVALLLTFITYCAFAHLRTHPIQARMHLVVALFFAQLVFLLGAGSTDHDIACTSIAVLSHYLWMCTFSWSTVLSYDLNKTFSPKQMGKTYREKRQIVIPHVVYGWATPLLVIIPCLVLHVCACSDLPFQYGFEGTCWIYNQDANMIFFGGPLVAALLVNVILFCNIMWNIHATKRGANRAQTKDSGLKKIKEELTIYAKIATLLGFTWIFAFSAAFSGISALWYIYIIVNSLQGLYIFLAFTFTVRIGRLWADKLHLTWPTSTSEVHPTKSTNVSASQTHRESHPQIDMVKEYASQTHRESHPRIDMIKEYEVSKDSESSYEQSDTDHE